MISKNIKTQPAVVALGGGHGLAAVLKSIRLYTSSITGIVSVADDGGSSGTLRSQYGIPAPGDIRRCISALASTDSGLLARHLEDRFFEGQLQGHPIGNLLLTGLALASNNFQAAVDELSRLVGTVGSIYPAANYPVNLVVDSPEGEVVGQVAIENLIKKSVPISQLRFSKPNPPVSHQALQAIAQADQITFGPGDLLTSVLAAVIVPDILQAIQASSAQKIFIANIKNTIPLAQGTSNDVADQVAIIKEYGVQPDIVLSPRSIDHAHDVPFLCRDVLSSNGARHEPAKLAKALQEISKPR